MSLQVETLISEPLSNEYRLLLACARRSLNHQDLAEAQSAIAAGIEWKLLRRHAEKHGLTPLLFHHLQGICLQGTPNERELKQRFFEIDVKKLWLSGKLIDVFEALEAAGIRALAYKGPVLAVTLYGDITLREMSDLDILIDPVTFSAAHDVLVSIGYQTQFRHSRKQQETRFRSDCELEFLSADGNVSVDLHWGITPPHLAPRFSFDELWDCRRMVSLGPESVPTFSAEDTTLVLAVHGGKHLWQQLSWLADFAESLRPDLDWHILRSRARQAHAERMLRVGLTLAKDFLGVSVPSELEQQIKDDAVVTRAAAHIVSTLFEDSDDAESSADRWLTTVRLADSRWEGLRCAARFAFQSGPREWQAIRLPDFLFGLYRFLRIAALLRTVPAVVFSGRRSTRS